MQTFRLQLALAGGQDLPAEPCILDQRLHDKPHHQPILFVNDSLAPDLHPMTAPANKSPSSGYGASPSPKKQAGKPSVLRSALNAVSKSFSAYHKGSAKAALQQGAGSDTIGSQPVMHHSYSAGQPDWLLQSRHASMNFDTDAYSNDSRDVNLLVGADGGLDVKVPLRATASCPVYSPVAHTRSSLMHSLSRSGMSHTPTQLAATRRR